MNNISKKRFRALIVANTGMSVDLFAKKNGYSAKTLYQAINTRQATERVKQILSIGAGVPVSMLFEHKKAPSSGRNTAVNVGTATTVPEDGDVLQAGM